MSTTTSPEFTAAPFPAHDVIAMLDECATICTDGEKRYSEAAAETRDLALKELFLEYAKQRGDLVVALGAEISSLGGVSMHAGTAGGALHRGFMAIRSAVEDHDAAAILNECERGERGALLRYDRVLRRFPSDVLTADLLAMLLAQRAAIKDAHDDMLKRLAQH
jgi:uncharacterized protein (TIGR02284 family)